MATIQKFDRETMQSVSVILRYNMEYYLQLYSWFLQNNQPLILEYFTQQGATPDSDSFEMLAGLIKEATKISNLISVNRGSFNRVDYFEFFDYFEETRENLFTINNTSKYTRSSKAPNSWQSTSIQVQNVLGQWETLEDIQNNNYGDDDIQNKWVDISKQNDLLEQDYTPAGGNKILINKGVGSTKNFFLNSIVDNLVGERLYGLDMAKKLTIVDGDMNVLNYIETVKQSISILILVRKGDIPEFPKMGVDPALAVGFNTNVFYYATIIQQFKQLFETDDSLVNFSIVNFNYSNGDLFLNYNVGTFYNLVYQEQQAKIGE